jgi:preprotein translocase subunit YajC
MYFVIIRPQQKEAKARKEMIDALQKGDKVITAGGIIVTVYKVEEQFLSVKINEDTTVKITKDSVIRKYEDEA